MNFDFKEMKKYDALNKFIGDIFTKENTENSNASTDANSFCGQENVLLEKILEAMALNAMKPEYKNAHISRLIYQHDLSKWYEGMHNCAYLRLSKLLKEGAEIGQGDTKPANNFDSAMQLTAAYIQCQQNCEYGGVGICSFDYIMVPYIRKLIVTEAIERLKTQKKENLANIIQIENELTFKQLEILTNAEFASDVFKKIRKTVKQKCQALITNLVTLHSRAANTLPFSSINLGLEVSEEGRLFNTCFLEELDRGIGRKNQTAIFPITCYQYAKGYNLYEGDEGYEVTMHALEICSRRHYPVMVNCQWSVIPWSEDPMKRNNRMG